MPQTAVLRNLARLHRFVQSCFGIPFSSPVASFDRLILRIPQAYSSYLTQPPHEELAASRVTRHATESSAPRYSHLRNSDQDQQADLAPRKHPLQTSSPKAPLNSVPASCCSRKKSREGADVAKHSRHRRYVSVQYCKQPKTSETTQGIPKKRPFSFLHIIPQGIS